MNAGQENRGRVRNKLFGLQGKSETRKSSNKHLNFGSLTIKESVFGSPLMFAPQYFQAGEKRPRGSANEQLASRSLTR